MGERISKVLAFKKEMCYNYMLGWAKGYIAIGNSCILMPTKQWNLHCNLCH